MKISVVLLLHDKDGKYLAAYPSGRYFSFKSHSSTDVSLKVRISLTSAHIRRTYPAYTTRTPAVNLRTRRISVFIRLWTSPDISPCWLSSRCSLSPSPFPSSLSSTRPCGLRRGDPRILNSPWSHMSHEIKRFRGTTWGGFVLRAVMRFN